MIEKVFQVFYNSTENTLSDGMLHTTHKSCDAKLWQIIKNTCAAQDIIAVTDCQATRPPHWLARLIQPFHDFSQVNVTTALNSQIYELSPLAANFTFAGTNLELDHALFVSQLAKLFVSSKYNNCAFAVRNWSFLGGDHDIYATNNLLVEINSENDCVTGVKAPVTGDQRPLPAHALAEVQWYFSQQFNHWKNNAYPGLNNKPNVLHVLMDWGGGVLKWVNDFIESHQELNHYLLVSEGEFFRQQQGEKFKLYFHSTDNPAIAEYHLSQPIKATCVSHPEYKVLFADIIDKHGIKLVVVSTLIGHSMDCLASPLPTLRVLHDFFPHWPSLNAQLDSPIIDEQMLQDALVSSKTEPFGDISAEQLSSWQQANQLLLSQPNVTVVAPDQSVINNLSKLPYSQCFQHAQIIEHGVTGIEPIKYQASADPFKVLVLGRMSPPKGQQLLLSCLESLPIDANIEFILLGAGKAGEHFSQFENVKVIADYQAIELHDLVNEISPQLALLCSITSETFNFTLSELQMLGVPVLATKVGAFNTRVQNNDNGFLVAPNSDEINAQLLRLKDQTELLEKVNAITKSLPQVSLLQNAEKYKALLKSSKLAASEYQLLGGLTPNPLAQSIQTKQHEIIRLENETIRLDNEITGLETNLDEKVNWAKDLGQQITHLETNLAIEKNETKHLIKTIKIEQENHKVETDQLKSTVFDINEELKAITHKLNTTNEKLNETNEKLEQNRAALRSADEVITAMLNSRSWRVTKPLRSFTTYARHKRNALRFRVNQVLGWPKRLNNSLKSRGLEQTSKLAMNKLKKAPKKVPSNLAHEINENYQALHIKTSQQPLVSIIIPVYNHFKHTYHCLESLARLEDQTPFEVIVVDDCSTDNTAQLLQPITGILAHTQTQNGGFIESCNTGAALAKGQFLLFLNNDTEVLAGWLDSLVQTFTAHPDAGLVGSQLIYPDGRLQEAGGIVFNDASGWNYGRFDTPDNPEYQHLREVSYCSGASIIISTQLFNDLGCFDQRYKPAYYEDTDLAFAVRAVGKKVYYQPLSKIIHFEGISSGTDLSSGTKKYQVINQQKFLAKWQKALNKQPKPNTEIELARFQNQPKKVLILDACTPTPDQDSGSLRMLHLMQIFNELNYQVSFIPENMAHFDKYTTHLQQMGVECVYAPKYTSPIEFLKSKGAFYDVVILSRYYVAKPLMSSIRSYCPKAQLWFDTVDLHYLREQRMAETANDNQQLKSAANTKKQELAIAKACDLTLVVSPYEQEVLSHEVADLKVEVLSNIHEIFGNQGPFNQRKDIMFIGGYQHTPNVDGLLWFVESIFPMICQALPNIKLHVIGSKAPKSIQDLGLHPNIVFHGFVEDINPFMKGIKLAVAPLRFGAGVKGKVNMSMSHGQPVVGTKVAVEGMYTSHEKDVMMADSPVDFAQCVIRLYQDKKLWNQVSAGGLANVKQWFSFDAAKEKIKYLLKLQQNIR